MDQSIMAEENGTKYHDLGHSEHSFFCFHLPHLSGVFYWETYPGKGQKLCTDDAKWDMHVERGTIRML